MNAPLAYWVDAAGKGALRAVELPLAREGDVDLRAQFSGVSPGTERLVGLGLVPASSAAAMACRGMRGSFALPILYGYSLVGVVSGGAGQLCATAMVCRGSTQPMAARRLASAIAALDCAWASAERALATRAWACATSIGSLACAATNRLA